MCYLFSVITVHLYALSLYQVQRESDLISLSFTAHSNADLRYLTIYGTDAILNITDIPSTYGGITFRDQP